MSTLRIILVRHAESTANVDPLNRIGGRNVDIELTERGIEQALELGDRLRNLSFNRIYSSPTARTLSTCRLSTWLDPDCITSELLEADSGDFTGLSRDVYNRPEIREQLDADSWNFIPGFDIKGESPSQVANRMLKWLDSIVATNSTSETILVFTHCLAIKYIS